MSGRVSEQTSREIEIPCVGYSVKADWYDASQEEVVFILIGFTSQKSHYIEMANFIRDETDKSVLVLDYSGHGVSPFAIEDLTPAQNFLEVITVFDWLINNHTQAKITVFGSSYGGFLATQLTKYRKFEQLILRVPALYRPESFYTKWKDHDTKDTYEYRESTSNLAEHPLLKRATSFEGETLVITHQNDEQCPKNSTQAFAEAFKCVAIEIPNLKHSFNQSYLNEKQRKEYYELITDWMNK